MSDGFVSAGTIRDKYGYNRDMLLRLEREGKLPSESIERTQGGQRRYSEEYFSRLRQGTSMPRDLERALLGEMGSTGLSRWGESLINDEFNELKGIRGKRILREMHRNDPVISAVFSAIERLLVNVTKRIVPASELIADHEAATFVEQCFDDMSFTWSNTMEFILQMLEQGFSVLEVVYKRRMGQSARQDVNGNDAPTSKYADGRIGWRKWAPRPAITIDEWVVDRAGGIQGFKQTTPEKNTVTLSILKCLLFRTTVGDDNSPNGLPIHRSMYVPWKMTSNLQEIEGIGVERDLNGIPVVYLGDGTSLGTDPNSDWSLAKDLVVNLRNDDQTGIVVPHPKLGLSGEGRGMLIELLSSSGRRSHDITKIIERYDRQKAMSVLAQFIMLGMQQVGSYALASNQSDLFIQAISSWLHGIADVINVYAIPRLMALNSFPNATGNPRIEFSPVGLPDLFQLSNYVNLLVQGQILTPDTEMERYLRNVAHLPPKSTTSELNTDVNTSGNIGDVNRDVMSQGIHLRRMALTTKLLRDLNLITEEEADVMVEAPLNDFRALMGQQQALRGTRTAAGLPPVAPNPNTVVKSMNVDEDFEDVEDSIDDDDEEDTL